MSQSKFSGQLKRDSGILRLMQDLGQALDQASSSVQMLGGGNPAAIPEVEAAFRAEMERLLADGAKFERMIGDYDAPQGNRAFIEALAELLRAHCGWSVGPEHIAITNGSQSGFSVLFNLFAGAQADGSFKRVLLPMTPEYIGYAGAGIGGDDAGRSLFTANQPVIERLDARTFKYRVDFDRLKIDHGIGAVCISRPTNPTGNVVTDDEVRKLHRAASDGGVPLIIDGAYGLPFPGIVFNRARPFWDERVIACLSLSKLGLPGARTGIIVAAPEVIEQITSANAIFTLAPGRFGPSLATRMLQSGELLNLCADAIAPYYRARSRQAIELIHNRMHDLPVQVHSSEGAIFLWLWFPDLPISSETLYQRLKRRGVLVIAGQHFFPGLAQRWRHRDECIRVTYAADPAQLERGVEAIAEEARRAYAQTSSSA
ncbi:MAG: valine--pyruvate transaminase [bacterium]